MYLICLVVSPIIYLLHPRCYLIYLILAPGQLHPATVLGGVNVFWYFLPVFYKLFLPMFLQLAAEAGGEFITYKDFLEKYSTPVDDLAKIAQARSLSLLKLNPQHKY